MTKTSTCGTSMNSLISCPRLKWKFVRIFSQIANWPKMQISFFVHSTTCWIQLSVNQATFIWKTLSSFWTRPITLKMYVAMPRRLSLQVCFYSQCFRIDFFRFGICDCVTQSSFQVWRSGQTNKKHESRGICRRRTWVFWKLSYLHEKGLLIGSCF